MNAVKLKKLFIVVVSVVITVIISFSCIACKSSNNGNDDQSDVKPADRVSFVGTHVFNVENTENYLVKDGKTDYVLVVPSNMSTVVAEAKNDFLILFKKATSVSLAVVTDKQIDEQSFSEQSKYISLGNTKLVEAANISPAEYSEEKLKKEGVRLLTKGNSVFMLGAHDFGISNAVYVFLEVYFNFDYYYRNCIEIDTNVTDVIFKKLDVTDVPDIEHFDTQSNVYNYYRALQPCDNEALGVETAAEEVKYMDHRIRGLAGTRQSFLPIHESYSTSSGSNIIHNVLYYIPKGSEGSCLEMFSSGNQLCYSGHGNADIQAQMVRLCADKIIFSLKNYTPDKYPYIDKCTLTMADNTDYCACPTCKNDYETIGYSGQVIKFVNKVARLVKEWLNEQKEETAEFHYAYRSEFTIYFFGYYQYVEPPVKEDGSPINEDVVCDDNVGVYHVSSGAISGQSDVYDPMNGLVVKEIKDWMTITEKSGKKMSWSNSGNVGNDIYFSDALTVYSSNFYQVLAYGGYNYSFYCHFYQGGGETTAWENLLGYVQSKLRWDSTRNTDYYVKKYMKAMYKDAEEIMYELYLDEATYYTDIRARSEDPITFDWGRDLRSEENFPYRVLANWVSICDKAIEKIAYMQETDAGLYKVVKQRIEIETSAHLYRILDLYGQKAMRPFNEQTYINYLNRIREIGRLSPTLRYSGRYFKDL